MTSQINPNNINGAYPVAGQDNNSQGFRDNFTNTGTNFQYAANEITDLQNNAVLKSALTGTTLNNDMNGSLISNAQIQGFSQTVVNLGTLTGSVPINVAAGGYQTVTTGGSLSLAFSNWTVAGTASAVTVVVTITNTAFTLQLPVALDADGFIGYNTSTGVLSFAATGTFSFTFASSDNGSTISVTNNSALLTPFNSSQETFAASAALSLAVVTSYFATAGTSTATLGTGVRGQIKIITMSAGFTGTLVVSLTKAIWQGGSPGTITFTAVGQSCILRNGSNSWGCIGNNGAVFG
jgi:hypothetical protein